MRESQNMIFSEKKPDTESPYFITALILTRNSRSVRQATETEVGQGLTQHSDGKLDQKEHLGLLKVMEMYICQNSFNYSVRISVFYNV